MVLRISKPLLQQKQQQSLSSSSKNGSPNNKIMNKWTIRVMVLATISFLLYQSNRLRRYNNVSNNPATTNEKLNLRIGNSSSSSDSQQYLSGNYDNNHTNDNALTISHNHLFDRERYIYHPPQERTKQDRNESTMLCGSSPEFLSFFHLNGARDGRSVNNEDSIIYHLFEKTMLEHITNGTYIELGAYDGKQESNTRFFDECLHWDGLLIEGNPTQYDQLVLNRPFAHRLHFAPSCNDTLGENQTIAFHSLPFTNAGVEGYALSYPKGAHITHVPCGSLTPVIQELLSGHVHFFSLDVEGSEPLILQHTDFTKIQVDMIMVESWNNICPRPPKECQTRNDTRTILKKAGYYRYSKIVPKSDLYIHPKSLYQLPSDQYIRDG